MNRKDLRKNVLVTGATGGIGSAVARKFYDGGFNVALHYAHSREKAELLAETLSENDGGVVRVFGADFTDPYSVGDMFREIREDLGEIDILVNNAGKGNFGLVADLTYEEWRTVFAVNVDAAFLCTREVLPYMIRQRYGKIVNVSSIWGITGASCEADYSAAKAALIGFTKALAKEVGPSGINVNCVAPGIIDTEMNARLSPEEMMELIDETPLMRLGLPQDVAETVFFLCGEGASFITGQVISPNGGFVI